tara:strand:+ start:73 stop:363 length:291 start_codon:yes stop_codon:yes gene_type:complete
MESVHVIARGTERMEEAQILVEIRKSEMKLEIHMMTGTLGMIKGLVVVSIMLTITVDLDHAKKVVDVAAAKINTASLNPKPESSTENNTFRNFLLT